MTTIEELKEFGFHCNNMIEVKSATFAYPEKEYVNTENELIKPNLYSVSSYKFVKGSINDKELIESINNASLVAWYPFVDPTEEQHAKMQTTGFQPLYGKFLRYKILK